MELQGVGEQEKINILLVDDQPAKLLSYEVILAELGETLIKAGSASEALEHLLKAEVAVLLVDVVVPEVLRAKVRVFAELHRKTRDLERLNRELELRVSERTAMLENSIELLRE